MNDVWREVIPVVVFAAPATPTGFWSPQVVSAVITGFIALITAGIVGTIAFRQWRTAQDKLALDLFDRRLAAYQGLRAAVRKRMKEVQDDLNGGKSPAFVNDTLHDIWENFDDAYFLFGEDVRDLLQKLDDALFNLGGIQPHETISRPDLPIGMDALSYWSNQVHTARTDLRSAVGRYMAMHTVGVAKPEKVKPKAKSKP